MAGLSELDYEKFPQGDQVMNRIMSPMSVVQQAWDQINRDKQNQLKEQYNQEVLGDLQMRNPLERMRKLQEIQNDEYKGSPEYQEGMRNTIQGQGMSNLSAGQTASVLQPFREKAGRAEAQQQFQQMDMRNQISQIDQALGIEGLTPQQRGALVQERERLGIALRTTPEHLQKRELKETGTDSAEYIAELRAEAARKAAAGKGSSKNLWAEFAKQSPEKRLGTAQAALESGVHPWTGQPLDAEDKALFLNYFQQDARTVTASNAAKVAGKSDIELTTKGKVPNVSVPSVTGASTNKPDPLGIRK